MVYKQSISTITSRKLNVFDSKFDKLMAEGENKVKEKI